MAVAACAALLQRRDAQLETTLLEVATGAQQETIRRAKKRALHAWWQVTRRTPAVCACVCPVWGHQKSCPFLRGHDGQVVCARAW